MEAVKFLRTNKVTGASVVGAYHYRRVAPLMERRVPLFKMGPGEPPKGTVLVRRRLPHTEVAQRVKEALDFKDLAALDFVYPIPDHPAMRLMQGFLVLVGGPPLESC